MTFNLDELLCSKKLCENIFSKVSCFHIDASHSDAFVSASGRVKASFPAVSLKHNSFFCSFLWGLGGWGCCGEVRSYAFDSNSLVMLLAIWALRHDFVLRTGLQCNTLFLVLVFFPTFFFLCSCLFLIPRLLSCISCAVPIFSVSFSRFFFTFSEIKL